jgi:hypothetical protein
VHRNTPARWEQKVKVDFEICHRYVGEHPADRPHRPNSRDAQKPSHPERQEGSRGDLRTAPAAGRGVDRHPRGSRPQATSRSDAQ